MPPSSWVAQCFSCRSSSLGAWHWRCTPPCSRTCILFVWSLVCHGPLVLSPSRPCQCLPALFDRARHMVACARPHFDLFQSHILATLAFLWVPLLRPSYVGSLAKPFPAWTDLRLRLAAMASDLHGVRVDVSSDNFLPARENPVYSFNLPPSAVRLWGLARWGHDLSSTGRPSHHRLGPSSCPFCNDVGGSVQLGLIPAASHRPTFLRLHGTAGCSTPSTSRTRRRQSGPTFASSGSSANLSNHPLVCLPPSLARSASWAFCSACAPPRLSSQLVTLVFYGHSLNDCGCWFSSLNLRPGLHSAGPERIRETLVYIFVICAAEMLKFSDIVFFHVRTCRVRAWCSSDQS